MEGRLDRRTTPAFAVGTRTTSCATALVPINAAATTATSPVTSRSSASSRIQAEGVDVEGERAVVGDEGGDVATGEVEAEGTGYRTGDTTTRRAVVDRGQDSSSSQHR